MLVWMQNGCKCISCLPSWPPGWLGAVVAATAQGHERMSYCIISSPRKGPNSKYGFYQMLVTVAPWSSQKNRKLSHSRSCTLCINIRTILSKKHLEDLPTVEHRKLCSMLCGSLDGRGVWRRMDTCTCMAEFCSSLETVTALLMGYTAIQNKKFKNKWINNFLKVIGDLVTCAFSVSTLFLCSVVCLFLIVVLFSWLSFPEL